MNINRFRFCTRLTAACVPIFCFAGTPAKVDVNFGKVPLSFEANRGQSDARVDYLSRGKGYTLLLTGDQAVLRLETAAPPAARSATLRMKLLGASGTATAAGLDRLPGVANYFRGRDPSTWHTGIPTYQKVKYTGVYPGVDLVYYGNQGRLEHDFIVAPGADPAKMILSFEGARPRIDRQGDLCLTIEGSEVRFQKPVVYQAAGGGKWNVDGRYVLDGNRVRFELGAYDHSRDLVIDPLLVYGTYLGGSFYNYGTGIAVDSQGSAYVTGWTTSTNFPTQNAIDGNLGGAAVDAFVTKFNATGTALIYSTYLGGSSSGDQTSGADIAVDSEFNAYVGGTTDAVDFPVTPGAFQTTCICSSYVTNGFLTKISAAGSLAYSTLLGGNPSTLITGVAVDSAFEAYVTGYTESLCPSDSSPGDVCFPTTPGAAQPGSQISAGVGSPFAFVTKFDAAGANLLYSSLYGTVTPPASPGCSVACGQNTTEANAIAVDARGNAYITGVDAGRTPARHEWGLPDEGRADSREN